MVDLSKEIKAYALKNALEFGKADAGRILPKLFQHGLDKKDIKKTMPEIKSITSEINSLKKAEQESLFNSLKSLVVEHEEKEKTLPELPEITKNMIFRMAPYPSGALHIGNAKTYLINALYAEKYNSKVLLVMDDTIGSEEKSISPEAYNLIEEGFQWLKVKYEKPVIYKSDRLEIYYDYAEQLIKKDKAYVCSCIAEILRKNRGTGQECKCRSNSLKENQKQWKDLFKAEQGSKVLRLKTDMKHPNPAFRDRVLFKISDKKHPRIGKKYRVWPTLEMSWAIDDHELGITHIIRGNDLMIETDMEKFIWDIFGWKHSVTIHAGLVKIEGIEGAKLSKSKAQKEVESGEFSGWDDPRTWSLQSLKRRGIKPEAIREFIKEIGINKQDITIPIDILYAINRKLIDANTERKYFVSEPIKIEIEGSPKVSSISVPIHPDKPESLRKINVIPKSIFISNNDFKECAGKEVRLLHLYNIQLPQKGNKANFTSQENKPIQKIQWVSSSLKAKIRMEDGSWTEGLCEDSVKNLKEEDIIQFERVGFVKLDRKPSDKSGFYEFWFSHK